MFDNSRLFPRNGTLGPFPRKDFAVCSLFCGSSWGPVVAGQESTVFPTLQTQNSKRTAATGCNNLNVIKVITR